MHIYTDVADILAAYRIPRTTLAILCDVYGTEISAYLQSPRLVSKTKAERIEAQAKELQHLLGAIWPKIRADCPVPICLHDADKLKTFLEYLRAQQAEIEAATV